MNTAVAEKQNTAPAKVTHIDAMTLVSQAVGNGADVSQVDKLIELVKFNDQREALRAFNQAFTAAQSEYPDITRTKKGHNNKYATLPTIINALRPVFLKHGLSFRHEVAEREDGSTKVRCILAHEAGHSECAELSAPPDTSGNKNDIQAIGSAVTYLRRYTLEAVSGFVTRDDDDDGASAARYAGVERVSDEQESDIRDLADDVGADIPKLLTAVAAKYSTGKLSGISDIPACLYEDVMAWLNTKRAK